MNCFASKPTKLCVEANSVVCPCKFRCASMHIPLCVNANFVLRPCKFRRASIKMRIETAMTFS